ncbi:tRNA preQ1(34) S-adenosylmethionine ribosyltransferase-isomerase QueA [Buchnera aphidicola]|uniref:S-adenosylmethionine:tRNA ribosyltransferase-isomerase n=1 Tax=Buchnera aphidicola subsp. Acyrthosiphon pisum (strain Tuc7) TaxID=561501 RepID=QUEA_BUCAT|nr:tRNA preQ1(34) S-adenosylmethionine ribosyltransferase-isomerase QueA [Buchnera aphidicola]B8D737.1 RecName: Full=S-adenosylmethionine:tRNA ribosyltransferase-isomerase; AltName: Full=Queuosine biosynthesis protein QueA [Buchnera aphidicola str. Tuc7 (Acyrthosiphon pisum)]ACL29952.1 S-adenosylmethionine:tRNA ribosyltransferase-isomerase [Buchnera aphidicola str. Tuc7 (Acyrthosiphon pisum)]ADP65958.1 S-adenosylmethionine:tRNA ribosyltransferase-isomerase [Buchnera aphidicola str. LL01 (Acyrtho
MQLSDFSFDLPKSLISFHPYFIRSTCRLMVMYGHTGMIFHKRFFNIIDEINSGDLIILNNTQVIPARFFGKKESGGKVEVLVEKILGINNILASIKNSKNINIGSKIFFGYKDKIKGSVVDCKNSFFEIFFHDNIDSAIDIINNIGEIPLPPYIKRFRNKLDVDLYQTVYKKKTGSIAAPTAGLHFDLPLLEALHNKGVDIDYITLHIGSGTFQPIRRVQIEEHIMHSESVEVSSSVIQKIKSCKKKGGRIIAVGTSTLRALESAYHSSEWSDSKDFISDTNIFIYPGYKHNIVDALITNFHFPESTLIMLVCSFLGYKNTMNAYNTAIVNKYSFFSYGDAMYITHNKLAPYENFII